jgi:hypothetical protein
MRRILQHIELRKAELARSPFIAFVEDERLEPRRRLGFAPGMAPFVMGFADLNKYVLRDDASEEPLQKFLNTYTREDDGHWRMFLEDLRTLELDPPMVLTGALEHLWGEHSQKARQLVYGLVALVSAESPLLRLVIVESLEGAASVGFSRFTRVAHAFEAQTGKRLLYFGDTHAELENGHEIGTEDARARLAALELTPEQVERARGLVDRTFALFHALGDELLAHALRRQAGTPPERPLHRAPGATTA